jgi:hypothetical protein
VSGCLHVHYVHAATQVLGSVRDSAGGPVSGDGQRVPVRDGVKVGHL